MRAPRIMNPQANAACAGWLVPACALLLVSLPGCKAPRSTAEDQYSGLSGISREWEMERKVRELSSDRAGINVILKHEMDWLEHASSRQPSATATALEEVEKYLARQYRDLEEVTSYYRQCTAHHQARQVSVSSTVRNIGQGITEANDWLQSLRNRLDLSKARIATSMERRLTARAEAQATVSESSLKSGFGESQLVSRKHFTLGVEAVSDARRLIVRARLWVLPHSTVAMSWGDVHVFDGQQHLGNPEKAVSQIRNSPRYWLLEDSSASQELLLMMVFPVDSTSVGSVQVKAKVSSGDHWFGMTSDEVTLSVPVRVEAQVTDALPGLGVIRGRRQGGHLFFDADIDVHGQSVRARMMLDPGATICVLPDRLYRLGNAKDGAQLQKLGFDTANGRIECGVDELVVTIGAVKRRCRVAINADESSALLGAEFLGDAPYSVDLANEYVVLSPGGGGLVSGGDEQWLPQQVSGESWAFDPLEVQARQAQMIAATMAKVDMEGMGWWTMDARVREAQSKFALAVITHLASAGDVGLARHYYRQRRTTLRSEERAFVPDEVLR